MAVTWLSAVRAPNESPSRSNELVDFKIIQPGNNLMIDFVKGKIRSKKNKKTKTHTNLKQGENETMHTQHLINNDEE